MARQTALPSPKMLIIVAFLFGVVIAILRTSPNWTTDFPHFWLSARNWTHPYDESVADGAYAAPYWWPEVRRHEIFVYSYPPTWLLLMWPLGRLPMMAAFMLYNGITSALFMALCVRRVGWLAVLGFFSLPFFLGALTGQAGFLAGCGVIAAFEFMGARPRLAGAILAAIACIKPQVALAAPFVLLGRWDAVKAAVITGASMLLASLVFGPHRWVEWLHQLHILKAQMPYLPQVMPHLLFGGALWWRVLLIAIGITFAAWERGLVGFTVGACLCSPYFWLYDLLPVSFLGLLIVAQWKRFGPLMGLAPGAFGLFLIVCPTYSETITILCLGLIALRVLGGESRLGRAIEFTRPLTRPVIRCAAQGGSP
jgi:hypothetical protein